ncbi:cupin domain-containing protein [Rhodococcus jostii]|uniref:Cupin domain-containing protein n=1 Tax=Rhodococcus jostii TaxID=132919 RepID=A0ABU4CUP2_RHOJO|nr:cupin domain-containing protein [Rhodococcus jostii]MDV6286973.1 cupin domain-containing protein [Rhodococcus jostii]
MAENLNRTPLSYMQTYPVDEAAFEAFPLPIDSIIAGDPKTEVATLHQTEGGSVLAGVSRFTEGTYRYTQTADEINYVTRGRMTITSDKDDQKIECTHGSVTRLDKGVTYTKAITEPYEEIFVMFNGDGVQM